MYLGELATHFHYQIFVSFSLYRWKALDLGFPTTYLRAREYEVVRIWTFLCTVGYYVHFCTGIGCIQRHTDTHFHYQIYVSFSLYRRKAIELS